MARFGVEVEIDIGLLKFLDDLGRLPVFGSLRKRACVSAESLGPLEPAGMRTSPGDQGKINFVVHHCCLRVLVLLGLFIFNDFGNSPRAFEHGIVRKQLES